ncbi:MAG: hypothetical protein K6F94_09835 [Bacteroidaceae bacterium]|nr:hypothetical protein [Bacteroidaceae bacterium]
MLLSFTVASKEIEDFVLKLQIDGDDTFADLNRLIRKSCWPDAEITRPAIIYVCDSHWHPEHIIPEEGDYEHDSMADICLSDLLEDEGQRLIYDFDHEANRHMIMEVSKILYGQNVSEGRCLQRIGEPPALVEDEEPSALDSLLSQLNASALGALNEEEDDEREEESDGFNDDELDLEGFEISEE